MSDIKPASASAAVATPVSATNPQPPLSSDVAAPIAVSVAKPATQLHGTRPGAISAGVLDLRGTGPADTTLLPLAQTVVVATTPAATAEPAATPTVVTAAPTPAENELLLEATADDGIVEPVVTPAAAPEISSLIHAPSITSQRPASTPAPVATTTPVDLATHPAPMALSPNVATHPLVKRFPEHPAVAKAPETLTTGNDLPGQVATQLEALQAQLGAAPAIMAPTDVTALAPAAVSSPDLQQALDAAKTTKAPSVLKVGAALAAIAIMGGFVWLQNSPKLAFRSAASKAGIEASLPTYIPSSYHQNGPATVGDGQLTLDFRSPSSDDPLRISQKKTAWDSNSLRENFITRQSDNYVAVSGQGLTIFLYNDNASWVNHGIWYNVSGTAKLSREQILKVAYGL